MPTPITKQQKILLLSCCAPCSCAVIKKLHDDNIDFSVIFYNPNIHPESEYIKRRDEQKHLCELFNIPFIELEYNPKDWIELTKEHKDAPERSTRCSICFQYRLERVMNYAKENGFTHTASVLGVSRYKDLNQVNQSAKLASQKTGVPYLEIEGRKNGMQNLRQELIKELNLYNQKYCGCIYSMHHTGTSK